MTYVITTPCIDVKDGSCVAVCPVDCIYQGGRMFYIQPDECINCGICETICPVEAIYREDALPAGLHDYLEINKDFFGNDVSGLGSPQGAAQVGATTVDHPRVAAYIAPDEK